MHELYYGGLASWAVKRGGSLHPVFLPPEETAETGQVNHWQSCWVTSPWRDDNRCVSECNGVVGESKKKPPGEAA